MRDADTLGHFAGIMNVLPRTAGALAVRRRTVVVKLQRDSDYVVALRLQQRSRDRGVDAARHGDDHSCVLRTAFKVETVEHGSGHWCDRGGITGAQPGAISASNARFSIRGARLRPDRALNPHRPNS